ncbi:MAG: hypothetical protein MRJ92_10955 [Nitrospira sp.]|nr:hypothetical protein [Nitrospira sp.]
MEASAGYRSTGRDAADSMGRTGFLAPSALAQTASCWRGPWACRHPSSRISAVPTDRNSRSSLMQAALLAPLRQSTHAATARPPEPDVLRDHFTKYVRARGPLPVLRVDSQPYGLLPVAALDRWISTTDQDQDKTLPPGGAPND